MKPRLLSILLLLQSMASAREVDSIYLWTHAGVYYLHPDQKEVFLEAYLHSPSPEFPFQNFATTKLPISEQTISQETLIQLIDWDEKKDLNIPSLAFAPYLNTIEIFVDHLQLFQSLSHLKPEAYAKNVSISYRSLLNEYNRILKKNAKTIQLPTCNQIMNKKMASGSFPEAL